MRRYIARKTLVRKRHKAAPRNAMRGTSKEIDIPPSANMSVGASPPYRLASMVEQKFRELGPFAYTEPDQEEEQRQDKKKKQSRVL